MAKFGITCPALPPPQNIIFFIILVYLFYGNNMKEAGTELPANLCPAARTCIYLMLTAGRTRW